MKRRSVRHALARPGVESLNFNLVGRRVDVAFNPERITRHRDPRRGGVDRAFRPLAQSRRALSATIITRHGDHHGAAKAWAIASGVVLVIGWIIDGVFADSWSEAIFGRHGEHASHAHHPITRRSRTESPPWPACGR